MLVLIMVCIHCTTWLACEWTEQLLQCSSKCVTASYGKTVPILSESVSPMQGIGVLKLLDFSASSPKASKGFAKITKTLTPITEISTHFFMKLLRYYKNKSS